MTKYFRKRKDISENFVCYDCKQENKTKEWFEDLSKIERIICLVCRNKWYQNHYRPKFKEVEFLKKQNVIIKRENKSLSEIANYENKVDDFANVDQYFRSVGKVNSFTFCFICQEDKKEVEFFIDFQEKKNKRKNLFCKNCLELRIKYYREKKNIIVEVKAKSKKNIEKENVNKYLLGIRHQSALEKDSMPQGAIDLIITSPPYNVGVDYGSSEDGLTYEEYLNFSQIWLENCYNWVKLNGRLCLNIPLDKNKNGKNSIYADITAIAKKVGWKYQTTIIWNEGNISRRTAWGSWISASAPYVIAPVEVIVVFYKNEWKQTSKVATSDIASKEFIEWTNGLWTFSGENPKRVGHPAPFPRELPKRCIKLFSFVGDTILDPFSGSGTTLIEAINNKRYAWGLEVDLEYIKNSLDRISRECSFSSEIPAIPVETNSLIQQKKDIISVKLK